MTRQLPPRPVASASTVPPPEDKIATRLSSLKVIAGVVAACVMVGAGWSACVSSLASKDEVAAEHTTTAAALATVQADEQALEERVIRAEVDLAWIKAQLTEVAKATGARPVPPPPQP